jgi:hypothetical protein
MNVRLALAALAVVAGIVAAAPACADPICGTAGLPACAPPAPFTLTPEQTCAVIAWRTWVPCNWWGQQVPQGTPGSVG